MLPSREQIRLLSVCGILFDLLCLQVDLGWILCKFDLVVTVSRIFHSGKITENAESRGNSTWSQPSCANSLSPRLPQELWLRMLPTFVDHLDAVAFGIEDVGGVVSRVVVKAGPRLAVGCRPGSHGGRIEGVDLRFIPGHKSDMECPGISLALPQPEEHSTIAAEAFQIGVPFRAFGAIVVDSME